MTEREKELMRVIRDLLDYPNRLEAIQSAQIAVGREI